MATFSMPYFALWVQAICLLVMGNGQWQIKTWIFEYLETLASSAQTSYQGFISMNPVDLISYLNILQREKNNIKS
jgi:hypothetical protein